MEDTTNDIDYDIIVSDTNVTVDNTGDVAMEDSEHTIIEEEKPRRVSRWRLLVVLLRLFNPVTISEIDTEKTLASESKNLDIRETPIASEENGSDVDVIDNLDQTQLEITDKPTESFQPLADNNNDSINVDGSSEFEQGQEQGHVGDNTMQGDGYIEVRVTQEHNIDDGMTHGMYLCTEPRLFRLCWNVTVHVGASKLATLQH